MSKILCTIVLVACLFGCNGCRLLERAASDVGGWDISACVSDFDTYWELYRDNSEKFEDGFVDAMGGVK